MAKTIKLDDKFEAQVYNGPLKGKLDEIEGYKNMMVITPGNCVMPGAYPLHHKKYQNFDVKASDIFVVSYPKAGTTWTQEMVWTILFGLNHEKVNDILTKRFPFMEWDSLLPEDSVEAAPDCCDIGERGVAWRILHHELSAPRTIKSHLTKDLIPKQILEKKTKLVYVCRDPRDVCVSYYFHHKKFDGYVGTFDDFVKLFLTDLVPWSPFWTHVLDFWKIRNEKSILFLRYEELKEDLPGNIKKVAKFLEKTVTEEEVKALTNHLSFSSMKTNKAANNEFIPTLMHKDKDLKFMRKGQVGDWKNHFTDDHIKEFKKWTNKFLQGSDFPYYQNYD